MSETLEVPSDVVAGAWRMLCANLLLQAVRKTEADSKLFKRGKLGSAYNWRVSRKGADKEELSQKSQAREWLCGGVGVITYEEACETLGLDPDRFRLAVQQWAKTRKRKPLLELPDVYPQEEAQAEAAAPEAPALS